MDRPPGVSSQSYPPASVEVIVLAVVTALFYLGIVPTPRAESILPHSSNLDEVPAFRAERNIFHSFVLFVVLMFIS